jgi:hypothetical protein
MKHLHLIFITLVFLYFQTKTCNQQQNLISANDCNAILVGDTVFVYSEPGESLNRIEIYDILTLVKINETTSQRIILDSARTNCDKFGYFWYKIQTVSGLTGWVYGKHIYKFITDAEGTSHYLLVGKQFYLNNKNFYFGIAKDVAFPSINDYGLTGCENFSFPFFFTPDDAKIYPVKYSLNVTTEYEKMSDLAGTDWMLLEYSEKVIDYIDEIEVVNNNIFIVIKRQFQDEKLILNLTAELKQDYIEITSKKVTYE